MKIYNSFPIKKNKKTSKLQKHRFLESQVAYKLAKK